jgi:hypothetical protein
VEAHQDKLPAADSRHAAAVVVLLVVAVPPRMLRSDRGILSSFFLSKAP